MLFHLEEAHYYSLSLYAYDNQIWDSIKNKIYFYIKMGANPFPTNSIYRK